MTLPTKSSPTRGDAHIQTPLCTLAEWSASHIKAIFESVSDEESSHAIAATFKADVDATVNGKLVGLAEIQRMVRVLRGSSGNSTLRVRWLPESVVEVPFDTGIRVRTFNPSVSIAALNAFSLDG